MHNWYSYFVFFSESLRNIFHRLLAGLAVFDTVFLIISMIDSFRRHFRFHQLYVYGWGFSMKWNWLTCFRSWFLSQAQKIITKAKLLQLKPNPFIFMMNLIDKNLETKKTKPSFTIAVFKVEYCVVLVSSISNLRFLMQINWQGKK